MKQIELTNRDHYFSFLPAIKETFLEILKKGKKGNEYYLSRRDLTVYFSEIREFPSGFMVKNSEEHLREFCSINDISCRLLDDYSAYILTL
jgi:hypothetical protein